MYTMVITTTDNREIAERISVTLLEKKLAACVQIDSINSFFRWNNEVQNAKELRLTIKTKTAHYLSVERCIKSLHNYSLPQIISVDISDGLGQYFDWIDKEVE